MSRISALQREHELAESDVQGNNRFALRGTDEAHADLRIKAHSID